MTRVRIQIMLMEDHPAEATGAYHDAVIGTAGVIQKYLAEIGTPAVDGDGAANVIELIVATPL